MDTAAFEALAREPSRVRSDGTDRCTLLLELQAVIYAELLASLFLPQAHFAPAYPAMDRGMMRC